MWYSQRDCGKKRHVTLMTYNEVPCHCVTRFSNSPQSNNIYAISRQNNHGELKASVCVNRGTSLFYDSKIYTEYAHSCRIRFTEVVWKPRNVYFVEYITNTSAAVYSTFCMIQRTIVQILVSTSLFLSKHHAMNRSSLHAWLYLNWASLVKTLTWTQVFLYVCYNTQCNLQSIQTRLTSYIFM